MQFYKLKEISRLDMASLSTDVKTFLFNPNDTKRITMFKEFLESAL